jgi:uncharacterized protein (DUF1778 family)
MPQLANRSQRIEARVTPDALATIRRAAEIQGRSLSDFLVAAAHDAAEKTIRETQIIRLSIAEQERVADLLDRPTPPSPGLKRALESHRRLIRPAS